MAWPDRPFWQLEVFYRKFVQKNCEEGRAKNRKIHEMGFRLVVRLKTIFVRGRHLKLKNEKGRRTRGVIWHYFAVFILPSTYRILHPKKPIPIKILHFQIELQGRSFVEQYSYTAHPIQFCLEKFSCFSLFGGHAKHSLILFLKMCSPVLVLVGQEGYNNFVGLTKKTWVLRASSKITFVFLLFNFFVCLSSVRKYLLFRFVKVGFI